MFVTVGDWKCDPCVNKLNGWLFVAVGFRVDCEKSLGRRYCSNLNSLSDATHTRSFLFSSRSTKKAKSGEVLRRKIG